LLESEKINIEDGGAQFSLKVYIERLEYELKVIKEM
jgi:DNA polymerase III alpha subunit